LLPFGAIFAVRRQIGMDAFGNGAIEPLHFRRSFECARCRLGAFASSRFGFVGARAGVACRLLGSIVVGLFGGKLLGYARLQLVELGIARADKVKVSTLERAQLGSQV